MTILVCRKMLYSFISKFIEVLRTIYIVLITLSRDVRGIAKLIKAKKHMSHVEKNQLTVADIFKKWVREQPNKPCIRFNDITWTFDDLERYANKVANAFAKQYKLEKGDAVCLFMENKPEFVGLWLGLSKIGVISALLNTNLRTSSLIHCIKVAKPKLVIFGAELEKPVLDVRDSVLSEIKVDFVRQGNSTLSSYESSVKTLQLEALLRPASDVLETSVKCTDKDVLMYIYTSGTTGLPKPAIIKNNRYLAGGFSFFNSCSLTKDDVFLVTLPIYHSNAGVIGIGAALVCGATVVLRRKFSASNFWKECIEYKCTAFSYVGEVCRYLLNQPPSPLDKQHSVRLCVGNGMRSNIHKEFSERFNVKGVEIYGATEGNCVLVNIDGKYGACGFIPILGRYTSLIPIHVIKVDNQMNPIRDNQGRCVRCKPNEKGLLIGLINKSTRQEYSGYANSQESTNKKIINDTFRPGQKSFNTGDLVLVDELGWVYFVDRLGDTYRWRGENVSTIEVENIISSHLNSIEVIAYGVEIPGQEGRAGMATIMLNENEVNMKELGEKIKRDLPAYAKPYFIRLNPNAEHTGSFKASKTKLIEEAYNVNVISDILFYFDLAEQAYKRLTPDIYDIIKNGKFRC